MVAWIRPEEPLPNGHVAEDRTRGPDPSAARGPRPARAGARWADPWPGSGSRLSRAARCYRCPGDQRTFSPKAGLRPGPAGRRGRPESNAGPRRGDTAAGNCRAGPIHRCTPCLPSCPWPEAVEHARGAAAHRACTGDRAWSWRQHGSGARAAPAWWVATLHADLVAKGDGRPHVTSRASCSTSCATGTVRDRGLCSCRGSDRRRDQRSLSSAPQRAGAHQRGHVRDQVGDEQGEAAGQH